MRKGRDNGILVENNVLLGVNLGADHCAEHEWGIKGIKRHLGIDESKMGLDKRIVSSGAQAIETGRLRFVEDYVIGKGKTKTKWSGIVCDPYDTDLWYLNTYVDSDLISFWNENGFCVVSSNKDKVAQLRQIFEAFKTNDVAVWLGGGGVFQNAGLVLGIVSHLPKDVTDNWLKHDQEVAELQRLKDESGIEKFLKKLAKSILL